MIFIMGDHLVKPAILLSWFRSSVSRQAGQWYTLGFEHDNQIIFSLNLNAMDIPRRHLPGQRHTSARWGFNYVFDFYREVVWKCCFKRQRFV